ncbi:hypothetical protein SKAU_G00159490 [Synaphobranchus kaupii]|uniref:Uncharacterized protein n=1 Tax=Synaphobranchus kaupii TaxID=118154 RepID=A0A9Q1FIM5_SYNKA|nr:hypothetical protein SKAU_G00159490 [Synaphobranchus kaupii]
MGESGRAGREGREGRRWAHSTTPASTGVETSTASDSLRQVTPTDSYHGSSSSPPHLSPVFMHLWSPWYPSLGPQSAPVLQRHICLLIHFLVSQAIYRA